MPALIMTFCLPANADPVVVVIVLSKNIVYDFIQYRIIIFPSHAEGSLKLVPCPSQSPLMPPPNAFIFIDLSSSFQHSLYAL